MLQTCLQTTTSGTCRTLYRVSSINSGTSINAKTYTVSIDVQVSSAATCSDFSATNAFYWGDDYEIQYDAEGPLFKLKKTTYDMVPKTVEAMKDDTEQFAKTPYTCLGTASTDGCRILHHATSITSGTAFVSERYNFQPTTKEASEENVTSSTAKKTLDLWYETKFMNKTNDGKSVTEYIVDGSFCNDRSIYNPYTLGEYTLNNSYRSGYLVSSHTFFAPKTRLIDATAGNKSATLLCNTNDRFSVTSAYGNAKLTYPVALITADELALAGGKYNEKNEKFYLRTNGYFWTMSPARFNLTTASAGEVRLYPTGLLTNNSVTGGCGLRAVINLNKNVLITQGDGTASSPYELTIE